MNKLQNAFNGKKLTLLHILYRFEPDYTLNFGFGLLVGSKIFFLNIPYSLSDRSYHKLSFAALLKALRPLLKELGHLEVRQNLFSNFQKFITPKPVGLHA